MQEMEIPGTFVLENIKIYGEDRQYINGYIKITNGIISEIGHIKDRPPLSGDERVLSFSAGYNCIPGFIDVHIHGAAGSDTMDATTEALNTIARTLPKEGTTSFLATTMTQKDRLIERALINTGDYIQNHNKGPKAEVLGIHLEGPFISPEKPGAQLAKYVINPDVSLFKKWEKISEDHIKLVTLAPEEKGGLDLVRYLAGTGVVASIGHSNATYEQMIQAVEAGAKHVTHLYNGMRGFHHREPGVAGAALLLDQLMVEMIVDGIHTRPEMVDLAYQMKGKNQLVMITDAIRAKCLKEGVYDLGGQDVTVENGEARLVTGQLAGSILKMNEGVQNLISFTQCTLEDAIQMASVNAAKQLGVFDRKGSIAPGKDGDVVIVDDHLHIVATFCRGELAYQKEGVFS